ncbi:hypothetical protein [Corynebacterium guangdongense]|uniref:Tetrahydromethanopterin S-methyltransferase subunit F n=1 Tax=Corynebacterium guangdongense TaxID=1783348 RepID=A0ABU1ZXE0_9CORY|nr:hypothetical protein [Corynebacterium guangdongense]MDR7329023.1 tetrahydromethanopterin S-methyltransferase subunit F [Corynebacterium guangdongense]WJZ17593.1 hypothetical protein CGUA_05040 [Corynebacterium guangdongense]
MFKSIGDHLIARADATVDDEFERAILHRSASVYAHVTVIVSMACMVVLAWALPGWLSLWSTLLAAPMLLAEFTSQAWLRGQIASPRARRVDAATVVTSFVFALAWAGGVQYRTAGLAEGFGAGGITGAVFGVAFALVLIPRLLQRTRTKDAERLAAGEED